MQPSRGHCPFCRAPIDPRKLDDLRQVLVGALETQLAHYACAKGKPLCPRHRQCFLGATCPRCAASPPSPTF